MNYEFYFNTHEDAMYFIDRAQEIAKDYGKVSLADLCVLAGDNKYDWWAANVYWTYNMTVFDMNYVYVADKGTYRITMPVPKDYYHNSTPRSTVKPKNTPEPLNITILMDPSKDPYTTIREVIQQANEIKDRPVFITIS